jgi:hypothetical protein
VDSRISPHRRLAALGPRCSSRIRSASISTLSRLPCLPQTCRRYLSVGMVRRPTIAMGGFVSAESRNGRLFIVRQNNIAGAIAYPRASDTPRRSTLLGAKCAHFSHRHNALDNRTIIRMIILRGQFEFYVLLCCTADIGAHHPWRPLLQALFMIARVLTVTSTIAVRIIAKGVFIVTSPMRAYRPSFHSLR